MFVVRGLELRLKSVIASIKLISKEGDAENVKLKMSRQLNTCWFSLREEEGQCA